MNFTISDPVPGDEVAIGPVHLQSWHETYVNQELSIDGKAINEMVGFLDTPKADEFRKNTILEAKQNPDKLFYKVVKDQAGKLVGFIHGTKHDKFNSLDAIYLLDLAKGTGVAQMMMKKFLAWIDPKKPTRLESAIYNARAIHFYEKYGFVKTTKKLPLYRAKIPLVEMVRKP